MSLQAPHHGHEEEKLKQLLREGEERFQNILESIEDGYYEVDLAGNFTFFNSSFCRILAYSSEELMGMNNRVYMDPETAKKVFQAFQEVYKRGNSLRDLEYFFYTKDGTRKTLEISVSLIMDPGNNPIGFRGIARDITRRKEIEQELKRINENLEEIVTTRTTELARTTQFFEEIFNSSLDGIITTNLKGTILYVSPRIRDILGYDPKEVLGRTFQEFFGLDPAAAKAKLEEVVNRGEMKSYELETPQKNGAVIVLNLSSSLLRHDDGEAVGITTLYRDVSEEKKMTEALARAKEKAEAASRAKSQFLANMSHEIRTPLNGILGMAELTLESDLEGEQKRRITTIKKEADSLLHIVNEILDFSKIEAGKCEIEQIPFDLKNLFEDVAESFSYRMVQKGLECLSHISPGTPDRIVGDPGRLRQVLRNLIGNALKFTHEGQITIKVEPLEEWDQKVKLRFLIKDTGIGIPSEKQTLIFESFTQADGSTTRQYGGTGLGLTISKQLIELMGGEIGIESEPGKGSTFWFTASFQKKETVAPASDKEIELSMTRVLVVIPNKSGRRKMVQTLKGWGADPLEADSPTQALSLLKHFLAIQIPINLVVGDLAPSEMSCFDLAQEMGRLESLKTIPMIVITELGNPGDGKMCRDLGIAGYLSKPFSDENLFRAIQTVLNQTQKGLEPELVTKHSILERQKKESRILLVEDYPTNQEIALRHLQQAGYQVDLAENGQQALEAFKRKSYDLIFMDVQMPIMDGYQATKAIRELESAFISLENEKVAHQKSTAGIPIIAMTAHAMKEHQTLCLEAGMNDFISKPLTKKTLLAKAAKWLSPQTGTAGGSMAAPSALIPVQPDQTARDVRSGEPIDLEKAIAEFEGDKDFLAEVLEGFFTNVTKQIGILRQALSAADAETIRKEAHSIKGGAANLTAMVLSHIAFELEKKGKSGELQGAAQLIDALQKEFDSLQCYWKERHKQ
jgi:PAS domain S-box-containing protein